MLLALLGTTLAVALGWWLLHAEMLGSFRKLHVEQRFIAELQRAARSLWLHSKGRKD